ncbi:MAG: hypothetical protein K2J58_06325, partial [Muribaculaceae bacterium]|nr:hypothetical protein [Muribaculaceae bacterium]
YEHDMEDATFLFNDLGFDFIKVDFCGGDAPQNSEHLELDERERYTAISKAIKATGRTDVRYNVCRWAYPGTWVEDIATSWRMSQDINLSWESVKDIIHQNLYLSAYATKGRFNDMDMLEVGRGLTKEEDKTHFGMWCMMSSPLLIGCDLRVIDKAAIELLTNPELVALNQNPLALQAVVAKRVRGGYVLVKDVDSLRGNTRAVALYNPTDAPLNMSVDFFDVDLGDEADVRDLFEKKDLGRFQDRLSAVVPPHGTKIYKVTANRRIERRLYEAETAFINAYQETDNHQAVKSGIYEENEICSGGAKASWLGARKENSLTWRDVWSEDGGEYNMIIQYLSGEDRKITVSVNGESVQTLTVNSGGWNTLSSVTLKVVLNKGENEITLSNPESWMPDIDCMTLTREGDLELCRHRHSRALAEVTSIDITVLPEKMGNRFNDLISKNSYPEESQKGYDEATAVLNSLASEIYEALMAFDTYTITLMRAEENIDSSEPSDALETLKDKTKDIADSVENADNPSVFTQAASDIYTAIKAYLSDEAAILKQGGRWDMTCFIENPGFDSDAHGWKGEPVWGSHVAEYWNRTFNTSQTVTGLRNGNYTLSVQALYRTGSNDGGSRYREGKERIPAEFSGNGNSVPVASIYTHPLSETPELESQLNGTHELRGYVNSMHGAEMAFSYGLYHNEVPVKVTDNTLIISIASEEAEGDCWCCFDNFSLCFQGTDDNTVGLTPDPDNDILDVYTPAGICVARAIRRSEIQSLPSGIYIGGGEKIIVK